MNKAETGKMLMTLRAVWSNEEITPEKIEAYHWLLGEFVVDDVMAAVKTHMSIGTFFPKPAELLAIIAEQNTPEVSPGEAWQIVKRQINRHGYDGRGNWEFDNPAISAAVRTVGHQHICFSEEQYARRDFEKAFEAAQQRQRRDAQDGTAALTGASIPVIALDRQAS